MLLGFGIRFVFISSFPPLLVELLFLLFYVAMAATGTQSIGLCNKTLKSRSFEVI